MKYDDSFLKNILSMLEDDINDLDMYSVYNGDKFNEQVAKLKETLEELK